MPCARRLTVKSRLLVDPLDGLVPTSRSVTSSNHIIGEKDIGRSSGSFCRCWSSRHFAARRAVITGIDTLHAIREGQRGGPEGQASSTANPFCPLAFRA